MSQKDITYLSYQHFLQKILIYAGPVLVSVDIFPKIPHYESGSNKLWYHVLQTTRLLIAHCSINTENTKILNIIAHNIRNLYRLFGMDLAEHHKWKNVVLDCMYFVEPNNIGKTFVKVANIDQLRVVEYEKVSTEFLNEAKIIKQYIGHCIYNLVGKRKSYWENGMNDYKQLLSVSNATFQKQFADEFKKRPNAQLNLEEAIKYSKEIGGFDSPFFTYNALLCSKDPKTIADIHMVAYLSSGFKSETIFPKYFHSFDYLGSGIWKKVYDIIPEKKTGYKHEVLVVRELDGTIIVVDWNIENFPRCYRGSTQLSLLIEH